MVECPPQVARERQRELHWVERCGRPTTHGHTSPREAFPALIVFRNVPGGTAFHFHDWDWVSSAQHASDPPRRALSRARRRRQRDALAEGAAVEQVNEAVDNVIAVTGDPFRETDAELAKLKDHVGELRQRLDVMSKGRSVA
jgi:hypothetical protein